MGMTLLNSSKLIGFIATRDAKQAKAFYQETLGLRLVSEDGFAIVFDANGTMLRVTPVREMVVAPYTVLGWEVTDIKATAGELVQAGVVFERFPGLELDEVGVWTAPGSAAKVAWFKDPDGNLLSVSQHA